MSKFYGRISRRKLLSICSQIDSEGNPNSHFKNAPASRAIAFFWSIKFRSSIISAPRCRPCGFCIYDWHNCSERSIKKGQQCYHCWPTWDWSPLKCKGYPSLVRRTYDTKNNESTSQTAVAYFVESYQSSVNRNLSPLFYLPTISDRYCGSRFRILRGFDRGIFFRQILSFLTRAQTLGLSASLQVSGVYIGHSGYFFDFDIYKILPRRFVFKYIHC
jgi:hypothetical protein